MCGRFNIIDDPLTKFTSELLGLDFHTRSNSNVCPSESIASVAYIDQQTVQVNASWGIKPSWANRLIINAQAETVSSKKTFRSAFKLNRCIIPFSGWYEWKTDEDNIKHKYHFGLADGAIFMAGIFFENTIDENDEDLFGSLFDVANHAKPQYNRQLVTLTTQASKQCAEIHSRMPLLIPSEQVKTWLSGQEDDVTALLYTRNNPNERFNIERIST